MRRYRSVMGWAPFGLILLTACLPQLPDNTTAPPPERSVVSQAEGVTFWSEPGMSDALWAEIARPDGTGSVGGYLSTTPASRNSLIILLHGASTFDVDGRTGAARRFHDNPGRFYREAGFVTFSLDFRECGTPYGQGDLEDLVQVIDWLDAGGKQVLGVERVYTLGYSVGGTSVILANRQRRVTAAASIGGVTHSAEYQNSWLAFSLAGLLYPDNQGLCQLRETMAAYGPPGSPGWSLFDTVAQIHELTSPMIVVQGTEDQIYSIRNAQLLQAAYQEAISSGATLPPLEFLLLPGQDHFAPIASPEVVQAIIAFFDRFGG
ncbi:MAG TPA: prolyl oligopeptidase family serine peptidase [Phycisphaerae bacterium]|nr:prolyl oligopeptidase family serine peptidase [Phycisphaerae bacterium]HPP28058.1 prolyl oligopeptidase family serine peptidase [Phycisphaerae bacterium]HQE27262.1 prolyl oligopeptidase family serine peptidase [Phycisphaerae bacterium]